MQFPRVKPELRPRRLGGVKIRIGGLIYGLGSEIDDPTGQVWELLELLDGTRTVGQILDDMTHRASELTRDDVQSGLQALVDAGFIEDVHDPDESLFSADQRERYSRSRSYFSWVDQLPRRTRWHAQLGLQRAKVTVVGVGGTGGAAALQLAASGVGALHLVEPDRVELSNLNRQILYRESDIGRLKVEAAIDHLSDMNSTVKITGEPTTIEDAKGLELLAAQCDVLVLAADRPEEIRSWANAACMAIGTPWVHGGYQGPQVITGIYVPGRGMCYECIQLAEADRRRGWPQRDDLTSRIAPSVANAANAASAVFSGTVLAHEALTLITGVPQMPVGRMYAQSLIRLDHSFALGEDSPHPDCVAGHEAFGATHQLERVSWSPS